MVAAPGLPLLMYSVAPGRNWQLAELGLEVDRVQLLEGLGSDGGDRAVGDQVRLRDARAGDGDLFERGVLGVARHGRDERDARQDLRDAALDDRIGLLHLADSPLPDIGLGISKIRRNATTVAASP